MQIASGGTGFGQDRCVVAYCAWCGCQICLGRQDDLIDRESIFTNLNAYCVCAGRRKVNQWAKLTDAPAIVLPTPAAQAAAEAVFKVDDFGACGADAALRYSLIVDAV